MNRADEEARLELLAMKKSLMDEKKATFRKDWKARMEAEEKLAVADLELDFAHDLKEAVLGGVRVSSIQNYVLRTKDWNAWLKWKNLGDLPTMRELNDSAKREEKQKAAGWSYDPASRVLTLNRTGEKFGNLTLDPPYVVTVPENPTLNVNEWTMGKDEWYDTYSGRWSDMLWTVQEIVKQLGEEGVV